MEHFNKPEQILQRRIVVYCPPALDPRQVMKRERGDQTSAKLRQRETNFH